MHVQALVAHAAVETLDVAVLDRFAGLDEAELDAPICRPGIKGATPELAAIVEREARGLTARSDHGVERPDHGDARQGVGDRHAGGFSRALIDDGEAPEAPAGRQLVADEVDAPCVIRLCDGRAGHPRHGHALPSPPAHRQAFEAIEALDALVIDVQPVALEPPLQARHAPTRMHGRELSQTGPERRVRNWSLRPLAQRGALDAQATADGPLAHVVAPLHRRDHGPALAGGHRSFPKTSFRIWRLSA